MKRMLLGWLVAAAMTVAWYAEAQRADRAEAWADVLEVEAMSALERSAK